MQNQNTNLAMVASRAVLGIASPNVEVEVHLANGLPAFTMVGLPEAAVRESKDRVRSAIINSGFEFPARRITVNLAPADLPKVGGRFDLPIAIGILIASKQLLVPSSVMSVLMGELALDGSLRKVTGILPSVMACAEARQSVILPKDNANEASLCTSAKMYQADHLLAVCQHLLNQQVLAIIQSSTKHKEKASLTDLSEVQGQIQAKRALEIAAAGGHSLLMIGPPGAGKSMLAQRLPSIMQPMSDAQALTVAAIYSLNGMSVGENNWNKRPFRAPHHSASAVALVGGGSFPKPGEISLAHNGVLFLDEFTEFSRSSIEQLREPLETGKIHIARANQSLTFPANFQLIAACNPCPCGFLGDDSSRCQCSATRIQQYQSKLSGPLIDRMDMHIRLPRVKLTELCANTINNESSETIKARVVVAQQQQIKRQGFLNNALTVKQLQTDALPSEKTTDFLQQICEHLQLSARAYHRIIRLSRTIADLQCCEIIEDAHIAEAVSLRQLDRAKW